MMGGMDLFIFRLKHDLHQSAGTVGFVFGMASLGAILAGLSTAAIRRRFGFGVCWIGGLLGTGLALAAFALTTSIPLIVLLSIVFIFVNTIHPAALIGRDVELGVGNLIMAGSIVNPGVRIGNFCFVATGAHVEHDNIMHDFSSISAGSITGGKVELGRFSAITLGVTVVDRLKIGEILPFGHNA